MVSESPILIVLKIDPGLKKKFKGMAMENDETMTSILTDCIKQYIANNKKVVIH